MGIRLLPALCALLSFTGGYIAFHPGWQRAPALANQAPDSFRRTAEALHRGNLLDAASPQERIGWLLEVCRQPPSLARDHALYNALQRMQPGDFIAAFADLPALAREMERMSGDARRSVVEAAIERWLAIDEPGALRWLSATRAIIDSESLKLPPISPHDLEPAFRVLARQKPDWMREQAHKLGGNMQRPQAFECLAREAFRDNPAEARRWLDSLKGTPDWKSALPGYTQELAAADPLAAADLILAQPVDSTGLAPVTRSDDLFRVFGAAAYSHPSVIPELLARFEGPDREFAIYSAFLALSENPEFDALSWMQEHILPELSSGSRDWQEHMASWMIGPVIERDAVKAIAFLQSLPSEQRELLFPGALTAWSRSDPDAMLEWISTQPPETLPEEIRGIGTVAARRPEDFARWAASLPSGWQRDGAQFALAEELAEQGRLAEAFRFFPYEFSSPAYEESTRRVVGQLLAAQNPVATAQWIATLPAGGVQASAAYGLVGRWAYHEPLEAAEWVQTLPAGGARDAATAALASVLAEAEPAGAIEWLEQITGPRSRAEAVNNIFRSWRRRDPQAAESWLLASTAASDVQKAKLLRSR
jgi:hypothetical protein